jgi:hypothetical protein
MALTFEQIPHESLQSGKKYKILNDNNSSFTGYYNVLYENYYEFKMARLLLIDHKFFASIYFKQTDKFFLPITKKLVQEAMEKRSLDMIIQRLIGDPHFAW